MDNGLLFPYRFCGGGGGTRQGKLSVPIGHGASVISGNAGAGKSTPDVKLRMAGSRGATQHDLAAPTPPRKASPSLKQKRPYRKPTLVGRDKSPKVIGRPLVKELGNLTP
jgi:hypothetical protein